MWLFTLETGMHSFTLLQKLPQNHHSYVWTESLSSMVLMPAQKLSGIAMPETDGHTTRDSDGHTTRDWWALWDMILLVVTSLKITKSYKFFHWKFSSTQIAWKLRRTIVSFRVIFFMSWNAYSLLNDLQKWLQRRLK